MYRHSLFYLNFTVKSRNVQISLLSRPLHSIKVIGTVYIVKSSEWPNMAVPNFFQQFSQKRLVQIWNGHFGHFKFFLTIFPKKTSKNLEWPKLFCPNLFFF